MPRTDSGTSPRRHMRRSCAALIVLGALGALAGCAAGRDPAPAPAANVGIVQQARQTERLEFVLARQQRRADALDSLQRERARAADELTELTGLGADKNETDASSGIRYGSTQDGDPSPWSQRGPDATPAPNSDAETIARLDAATKSGRITLVGAAKTEEITDDLIDDRLLRLLLVLSQRHRLTVSSLRISHPENVQDDRGSAVPSNHIYGRAADIAAVDGISCARETRHSRYRNGLDNAPPATPGPCLALAYEAAAVPGEFAPQEVIYYWRVPGPAGVSLENHDDHVHLGYRSYSGARSAFSG
jgi:hypothetical protein